MRFSLAISLLTIASLSGYRPLSGQTGRMLALEQLDDRVRVTTKGVLLTEYRYAPTQKYPWFYPVAGPLSRKSVTTESSQPWPHHHSLFFGADFVNGGNYWQDSNERGQILARETRLLQREGREVVFTQSSVWSRPGAESPFRDDRLIRLSSPSDSLYFIDFDVTLTALIDVQIGKSNHSLFAARMAPALSVDSGGSIVNAAGDRNAAGTFGKASPWADFHGTRDGIVEGLAIFNHPANRWSPPPWFTRDYGFFSPTPLNWLESGVQLAAGESLRLRYRVVVHAGNTEQARVAELYEQYAR